MIIIYIIILLKIWYNYGQDTWNIYFHAIQQYNYEPNIIHIIILIIIGTCIAYYQVDST